MTITRPNAYDQTARDAGARRTAGPRMIADTPHWRRRQVQTGGALWLLGALVLAIGITLYHVLGIAHEHLQLRRTGHEPRAAIG
jgi:hypothetical protein